MSNRHAGAYQGLCTHPRAFFQCDWKHFEPEERVRPVVIPRAKIRSLGEAAIRANSDLNEIVDPDVLSNPAMFTDGKQPWILHAYARLENDAALQLRAKTAKYEPSN